VEAYEGYLSCANCAKSLEEGYHPIKMAGERIQFVCTPECGSKWMRAVGEVFKCQQCDAECPITEHPCIEWEEQGTHHFCKDDCVYDYMIENNVTFAHPEAQPDVDDLWLPP